VDFQAAARLAADRFESAAAATARLKHRGLEGIAEASLHDDEPIRRRGTLLAPLAIAVRIQPVRI
jgi:hypothetical protein